ncbi:uncharacterized protein K452DRAFT_251950 [Aplosporella prunicola CBS 121167]|uniref:Cytochrome b5 heme-binding domain-containing protein n=1 Tax=Aplosporella prunicola CBS 121167 TaxID=1176127 RepID=A0A6A6B9U6_9PEZI|nr:uncharacterized protein K452DRAFT_251950 [Aplosporella prunicola CBS 121167]KAF2141042.1 hypothetical protein K452DRAFT_251950 [Aplosporella prunicola CBS 121167]
MIFGITVLVISFSFLVYHHPPRTWAAFLRDLQTKRIPPPGSTKPQDESNKESRAPEPPKPSPQEQPPRPATPVKIQLPDATSEEAADSSQTTPKASGLPAVPSFAVADHDDAKSDSEDEDNLPPPQFPALNSAQRASGPAPRAPPTLKPLESPAAPSLMLPPARPMPNSSLQAQRGGGLMPPPSRPTPAPLRGPSGPLPNRGPSGGGNSLGLPTTAPVKVPNPRQKVLLTPGHSPLDWAALCKSSTNLSGVSSLQRVTPSMLKAHNGRKNRATGEVMPAWSSYGGKVYNITPYLPFHPGGEGELKRAAGKDGEKLFHEVHPWVNWDNMLSDCVVGILVPEHGTEENASEGGGLDDMD